MEQLEMFKEDDLFGPNTRPERTLNEARDILSANIERGSSCPCCGQWAQLYTYSFHKGMAKALIMIDDAYKQGHADEGEFFHVEHYLKKVRVVNFHGYHSKLKFWGLLEHQANDDPKKKWSGYWRITDKGKDFVDGKIKVQKYARLYNGTCFGFEGDLVSIREILPKNFDYQSMLEVSANGSVT